MMSQYTRDFEAGRKARSHGIPYNSSKPAAWQSGWNEKNAEVAQLLREIGR